MTESSLFDRILPLRLALSEALGHQEQAGCVGHEGVDAGDHPAAALDVALVERAVRRDRQREHRVLVQYAGPLLPVADISCAIR